MPPVSSPTPRPVTARHEEGLSYFTSLLNWWLQRSNLSHERMSLLAEWGGGEKKLLIPSVISHLKRRNVPSGPNLRNLEGLAGANRAIWLWQSKGDAAAIRELGPYSVHGIRPEWLDGACWLPSPEDESLPLDYVDLSLLLIGELKLPYLQDQVLNPSETEEVNQRLSELLNGLVAGLSPAEAIRKVLEAYPVRDDDRRARIRDLLLGEQLGLAELQEELHALAVVVGKLRGLPEGSFTAHDLHAELTRDRRRY